ncbi:aldo/keto reductase [Devosia psychrophila]|uniref:Dehydratase n=1 Tax=Devosia psychrophila TaxID=728005 RepID=A0A0F5Q1G0_9HYPH|nr:aldo/keto reductase [Devosia psychrophila]KKC34733.1 dehydratase [Devosia psychrophila]SFC06236.1 Predicted oxidoreductase [Devosia psychrophila]
MQYRKLGNSGAVVSAYCLGTMTFGAESDEATSFKLMDDYVAAGGNFIDTANVYSAGVSEEIVGKWLKGKKLRDLVITTKGRFPMGDGPNHHGLSRKNLNEALDASLKRLGVEHIDLYQIHAFDALTPLEETLRFLDDSTLNGKIAYYGLSNFLGWQLTKAVWLAKANGYQPPVTLQPQYNLLVRDIEHEVVPAALDAGIGLLPWSPLGGGWLSGKYKRDQMPTGATRLGENPARGMEAFDKRNSKSVTWDVIGAVEDIAEARRATMAQVALAWVAAQPAVTSVILGARTTEQLADNLGAAGLELSTHEIATLSAVSKPEMSDYPYGEGGIGQRNRKLEGGR